MGITGLLPKCNQTEIKLDQILKNKSIAIDGHVLLHKFSYSVASDLVLKQDMSQLVQKYVQAMKKLQPICNKIILVFDGHKLQSKDITNNVRSDARKQALAQAKIQAAMGEDATRACQSAVSFSHADIIQIANAIINSNIPNLLVLIAPYEADAQLAHLELTHIVDYVITIDSDLLLYGLDKVIYKPDFYQMKGFLITFNDLFTKKDAVIDTPDIITFRKLCILSGCDYCLNPKGIGLKKLQKFYKNGLTNVLELAKESLQYGQRNQLYNTDEEYIKMLIVSLYTFKHHIVFDFIEQKCINRVKIQNSDLKLKKFMEKFIGIPENIKISDCFISNSQIIEAETLQQYGKPYFETQMLDEEKLIFDGENIENENKTIKYKIFEQQSEEKIEKIKTTSSSKVEEQKQFQWIYKFSEAQQM